MYTPDYIVIENISSIKNLTYDFKKGISQIIQGKNLDDNGQKSNGVGKSSFNDAIAFSLIGLSLRNITNDEVIRDGENEAYLEMQLTSKIGSVLLIKRKLSRKKAQLIEIYLNGEPKHPSLPDVNSRDKFIIDEIGISQKDLLQFFIITKERFKPYFKMSDVEKKNIINRFSNADHIDKIFPLVEQELNDLTIKNSNLSIKLNGFESKSDVYNQELIALQNEEVVDIQKLKNEYKIKIEVEREAIEKLEVEIKNIGDYIDIIRKDIVELDLKIIDASLINDRKNNAKTFDQLINDLDKKNEDDKSSLNKQLQVLSDNKKKLSSELLDLNNGINEINILKSQIESKLQSSINCPACDHEFILKSDKNIDELKNLIIEYDQLIKELNDDIVINELKKVQVEFEIKQVEQSLNDLSLKLRQEVDKIRKEQNSYLENIRIDEKLNSDIRFKQSQIKSEIERLLASGISKSRIIDTIEARISNYEQAIININIVDDKDKVSKIKKYEDLINQFDQQINEIKKEIEDLQKEKQRLNSWILKFKSFKSYLANQSNKNIEDLTNSYLKKMNTGLTVEISSHNTKNKAIKEKITETILRDGFPIGSFGRFSGGEQGRINMGLILANQTLINANVSPKGLDFILIDEVLESLDALGIENIIKAMNGIDKTLLLVTQNEINTLPNQTLTFVKKNGVTEIE